MLRGGRIIRVAALGKHFSQQIHAGRDAGQVLAQLPLVHPILMKVVVHLVGRPLQYGQFRLPELGGQPVDNLPAQVGVAVPPPPVAADGFDRVGYGPRCFVRGLQPVASFM